METTKELWIARDSDGAVHLFSEKPELREGETLKYWVITNYNGLSLLLANELDIDLTFENSPIRIL